MYNERRWHPGHWIRLGFLAVFAVFVAAMVYFMLVVVPNAAPGAYPMYPYWGFGWIWGLFVLFLLFGFLRFALWGPRWWGYRRAYGPWGVYGGYGGHPDAAYHVLRERYARGEITKEQYDAMLKDLYPQARQGP